MKKVMFSFVMMLACLATNAFAGGLWLNEFGTPAMGKARAGAVAQALDASVTIHNPAAMSQLEGNQWMIAPMLGVTEIEFDVESAHPILGIDNGDDAGGIAPGVSVSYTRELNEKWRFGVSAGGLAGAVMDFGDDWTGRYQAQEVTMLALSVMPSVAYELTENFSVSLGLPILYTKLELDVAVPNLPIDGSEGSASIDGDDIIVGVNLGGFWQMSEKTTLGFVFQTEFEAKYDGDAKLEPADISVAVVTDLIMARTFRAGISHQVSDQLTLAATLAWEDWSALDEVNISADSAGIAKPRNWEDTYHYAIGLDYLRADGYKISTGIAYDTSPVSASDRTADMPVHRQVRYAIGVRKRQRPDLEWGVHLEYADLGSAPITSAFFSGDFETNAGLFMGVSFNWLLK
jgi:long-chain fatty acid transport protein